MRPGYIFRCPFCGQKLVAVDDYGDWAIFVKRDGKMVRKSEARWFDPDFVLDQHRRNNHS